MARSVGRVVAAPPLVELAHDWLHAKSVTSTATTPHSDRARRQDLARVGRLLRHHTGRPIDDTAPFNLDTDLAELTPTNLSVDALLGAIDTMRHRYSPATVTRTISTTRSFCRWLTTRGHLTTNPFDDDTLHRTHRPEPEVRAFTTNDVTAMLDAAATPPPRAHSAWPTRDIAIIDTLAHCGLRANELCALQLNDIGTLDRPILHIRRGAKGGRRREIPLPHHTSHHIDTYLTERATQRLPAGARSPLFVRVDGSPLTTNSLYHLIKRVALAAGTTMPDDALVHALRHHYGLQLAIRGVPPATIQQLMGHTDPRTTAIYTRHASHDLINALDDAGWLTP